MSGGNVLIGPPLQNDSVNQAKNKKFLKKKKKAGRSLFSFFPPLRTFFVSIVCSFFLFFF
jgi:hypothetical protein